VNALTSTPEQLQALLADLPPDSLPVAEEFLRFLRDQARRGQAVKLVAERPVYEYPTVALPAASLNNWLNLATDGYDGDALADTEALYDEV
jgi:hypothetical protein